jgi:hypothetical protein
VLWVVRGGAAPTPVVVRCGITDGTVTEVTEVVGGELRPGDLLVTDAGGASAIPPAMRRVL